MLKKLASGLAWIVLTIALMSPGLAASPAELVGQLLGAGAIAAVVVYAAAYAIPARIRGWRAARAEG